MANEDVRFLESCEFRILKGGSILLKNVRIRSRHLYFIDVEVNGPTALSIVDSELRGASGGFLVVLRDESDRFDVRNSSVNYPKFVFGRVRGPSTQTPEGGNVDVRDSRIESLGSGSDGITFFSGGSGTFINLILRTTGEVPRLLWAEDCLIDDVEGWPADTCGPKAYEHLYDEPQADQEDST